MSLDWKVGMSSRALEDGVAALDRWVKQEYDVHIDFS